MIKTFVSLGLAAVALAGCANPAPSSQAYSSTQTMREQTVRMATVESVRNVALVPPRARTGTLAGVALGSLAGSQVGGGAGATAAGILGAVAGGIVGNRVETEAATRPGLEITVRLDSGELRAVTQLADQPFNPGDRVRLLTDGHDRTRVTL